MASRTRTSRPLPLVAALAASALVVVLSSAALGGFTLQALVATAAAAALAAALGRTTRVPVRVRAVRAPSGRHRGHVEAPTAYWCSVSPTSRPQRPRAPGSR
ncbi:MAG: hypothetical protein ACKOVB_07535 [Terrabacter sp.]